MTGEIYKKQKISNNLDYIFDGLTMFKTASIAGAFVALATINTTSMAE